jgi:hypothetical protein
MTEVSQRSAVIIPFPVRARKVDDGQGVELKPAVEVQAQHVPSGVAGGSWYHDAAIQDSKRVRER